MSYPSNRHPRDRELSRDEDDERERGMEGRERSYRSERESFRDRRPGERDLGPSEGFGERRYFDPYSGRSLGGRNEYGDRERERSRREAGYAPYPYGEERHPRDLEDWQRPWQLGEERGRAYRTYGSGSESTQGGYASRGHESREHGSRGQSEGPYRGRGPKGYQRSDDRLREDICERLTDDAQIDASELNVEVASGEVTLTGSVPDRRMKRAAEDLIEELSGVKQVHNHLRIEGERGHMGEREQRYTETRH